jgi:hypothetical protein
MLDRLMIPQDAGDEELAPRLDQRQDDGRDFGEAPELAVLR